MSNGGQIAPRSPPPAAPGNVTDLPSDEAYNKTIHNLSLACLVICPILIALPPRKFDLYTASLGTATVLSANRLHRDAYGQSIGARFSPFKSGTDEAASVFGGPLPTDRARNVAAELKRRRDAEMSDVERERLAKEQDGDKRGVLEKAWYGGEGKDWQAERDRENQQKLEEGKAISDIIIDQIWEVWNGGNGKSNGNGGTAAPKAG